MLLHRHRSMRATRRGTAAVALLAAGLLAGCGTHSGNPSSATPPTDTSGVTGTATIDGGCPLVRPDTPCPDQPLAAIITVTRTGSTDVLARVRADEHGRFRIPLAPGAYVLHPANSTQSLLPRAAVQAVTVPAGDFVDVLIRFDSGIRGPATQR